MVNPAGQHACNMQHLEYRQQVPILRAGFDGEPCTVAVLVQRAASMDVGVQHAALAIQEGSTPRAGFDGDPCTVA